MRVLITNDDGIASAGLQALVEAFESGGETFVVAPERERSATGHAITLHKPLRAHVVTIPGSSAHAWATNGTPADSRSEEHTSELQSRSDLVCRLLLEKKKKKHVICHT